MDQWQNKALVETNLCLLEKEILSDVTFLVGENQDEVLAHRCILASRSPVFYAMFCGPLAESREAISILDLETDIFKAFLRFLYTEDCCMSGDTVMGLMYAAKKYEVPSLVESCSNFLLSNLDTENACVVLQQCVEFDEKDLIKKCLTYICDNGEEVLKSSSFFSLRKEALQIMLMSDNLPVPEKMIYQMCVRWAKHKCEEEGVDKTDTNIRERLNDLIYLIRFPSMQPADFTALVSQSAILTDKEKVMVFQTFIDKDLYQAQSMFPSKPRFPLFKPHVIFERFKEINGGYHYRNLLHAIAFTASSDVKLTAVIMYLPVRDGAISGKLEVATDVESLQSRFMRLNYEKGQQIKTVNLTSPIHLKANERYHIILHCDGTPTFFGVLGLKDVVKGDVRITFSESMKNRSVSNSVTEGQIHGLQFE